MENPCHSYDCEVAFADTDASGWVHFTKILTYAERAEHDFLVKSDVPVFERKGGGWPRVHVTCDYKMPLKFQEKLQVIIGLKRLGSASICWAFEILKDGGKLAAVGEMIVAKVDCNGAPTRISDDERKFLEVAS
ncbi:acyl-CoA thioesterase [Luteolibacter sp. AS25]|uniref:acyl-CoA thioesterase n=1 Tax=Luteolibacter sp. AS25 TaxID=3135776 RepID=UPI00398B40F7